jgi:hypothetical protein
MAPAVAATLGYREFFHRLLKIAAFNFRAELVRRD